MKKTLLILFGLMLLGLFGCKKKPFDYRNKYIGNYDFTVTTLSYPPDPPSTETYTTTGKVSYGTKKAAKLNDLDGNEKKQLIVISYGTSSIIANLYEDGSFKSHSNFYTSFSGVGEFLSPHELKFHLIGSTPGSRTDVYIVGYKK